MLQYGDHGGAIGYLIGEENRGLEYMFIMMNAARFAVGMQGVAVAERAYQQAVAYAKERVQSRPVDGSAKEPVSIIHHPDMRRMLSTMRAYTRGRACARVRRGVAQRSGARPSRRSGAQAASDDLRISGADRQRLQHGDVRRCREHRRAGAWRHGLYRGNRCGAALSRRPHPADLRRHDRDPGERSDRPQDGARRRQGGAGAACADQISHRLPKSTGRRSSRCIVI